MSRLLLTKKEMGSRFTLYTRRLPKSASSRFSCEWKHTQLTGTHSVRVGATSYRRWYNNPRMPVERSGWQRIYLYPDVKSARADLAILLGKCASRSEDKTRTVNGWTYTRRVQTIPCQIRGRCGKVVHILSRGHMVAVFGYSEASHPMKETTKYADRYFSQFLAKVTSP